jgi:hypothetical protein
VPRLHAKLEPDGSQPAGYHVGGHAIARLRDVLDPTTPTLSLHELTEDQRVRLVVARLQLKPKEYKLAMIGPGIIERTRAIAEVETRSAIGRAIMAIEVYVLEHLSNAPRKRR